jgi:enolase
MTGTSPLELSAVHAVDILDSRGGPTLAVTVTLADGTTARAGGALRRVHRFTGSSGTAGR